MDPGSKKKTDEELELNTAEKLKEDDTESVGVTSEVDDSTKDVNGKEVDSPYSDLVNVGSSFVYTVDRNKVDKNKNITKILAHPKTPVTMTVYSILTQSINIPVSTLILPTHPSIISLMQSIHQDRTRYNCPLLCSHIHGQCLS